jgi:hypothetical protein
MGGLRGFTSPGERKGICPLDCKGGNPSRGGAVRRGGPAELSDPVVPRGRAIAYRIIRYAGDNRLMAFKSPYR